MTAPIPQPHQAELRSVVTGRERQITPDEAKQVALRLIAGAFGHTDLDKRPRFSIPCKPWDDDDCLIIEYINQAASLKAKVEELEAALRTAIKVGSLLLQNSIGCAVNHYGVDYELNGLPGWLVDAEKQLTECAALQPKGAA